MPTAGAASGPPSAYDPQTQPLTDVKTTDSTNSNVVDDLAYTFGNAAGTVSKGSGLLTQTVDSQNGGTARSTPSASPTTTPSASPRPGPPPTTAPPPLPPVAAPRSAAPTPPTGSPGPTTPQATG